MGTLKSNHSEGTSLMINALINFLMRTNDIAHAFNTTYGIVKGFEAICEAMLKWDLAACADHNGNKSKIEAVFSSVSTLNF